VVIGSASSLTLYYFTKQAHWLQHGLLFGSIFPITVAVIAPLANNKLFALHDEVEKNYDSKKHDSQISELVDFWNQLHWVRTLTAGASFIVLLKYYFYRK
jgi:hypothetical protein